MDQDVITLELLVRSGNAEAAGRFISTQELDETREAEKIAEVDIYHLIGEMHERGYEIDADAIREFLSQDHLTLYLNSTTNTALLVSFLNAVHAATYDQMETYALIPPLDVLNIDIVAQAIRRNPGVTREMRRVVERGYSLLFNPFDMDSDDLERCFPIVDQWRDYIDPTDVAQRAIHEFADEISNVINWKNW